jgi:hypothetical protein
MSSTAKAAPNESRRELGHSEMSGALINNIAAKQTLLPADCNQHLTSFVRKRKNADDLTCIVWRFGKRPAII